MLQTAFEFGEEKTTAEAAAAAASESGLAAGSLNAIVFEILSDGRWRMPWEICEIIALDHHLRVSDSSITARLRDLRKPEFGGHTIELRKRAGSRAYEYRLEK